MPHRWTFTTNCYYQSLIAIIVLLTLIVTNFADHLLIKVITPTFISIHETDLLIGQSNLLYLVVLFYMENCLTFWEFNMILVIGRIATNRMLCAWTLSTFFFKKKVRYKTGTVFKRHDKSLSQILKYHCHEFQRASTASVPTRLVVRFQLM